MRRGTNVSLTVMRRSRHRAEIADSELSFVFPIRHGALESSAGHALRLSVARLGVLSFMWFDQAVCKVFRLPTCIRRRQIISFGYRCDPSLCFYRA